MFFSFFMGIAFFSLSVTKAQVFLSPSSDIDPPSISIPESLSKECSDPLRETVQCNATLAEIATNGYFPTSDDLRNLCSRDCLTSLQRLREKQEQACATSDIIVTGGIKYPPTLILDELISTFNYTCRKDSSSQAFCAPMIESWFTNGTITSQQNCSDCFLGTLQTHLNSYFGYNKKRADRFSSLTKSCGKSNYPTSSIPPYTIGGVAMTSTSPIPLPTPSCEEPYIVKAEDTCNSISISRNISTHSLLHRNSLRAHCVGFPDAGTELCIPPSCDIYTVRQDDTCYGIAADRSYAFTVTQLISWNPNINRGCSNLGQLLSSQICLSPPGGIGASITTAASIAPSRGPSGARCLVDGSINSNCLATTPIETDTYWSFPAPTNVSIVSYSTPTPLPLAPGTLQNCSTYKTYHAPTKKADINSCDYMAYFIGITVEQLIEWNPSLSYNPSDPGACTLEEGYRYCVRTNSLSVPTKPSLATPASPTSPKGEATASPMQLGMTDSCGELYYVKPGDGCSDIAEKHAIAIDDFHNWNTAVKKDCSGLVKDVYVCVGLANRTTPATATSEAIA